MAASKTGKHAFIDINVITGILISMRRDSWISGLVAATLMVAPEPSLAQDRSAIALPDLAGANSDALHERLGAWVLDRDRPAVLTADLSGQRLDVIRLGPVRGAACSNGARVMLDDGRSPEFFVFLDDKLAFVTEAASFKIAVPTLNFRQVQAERQRLARKTPPGPLDYEDGIGAYYDQLHRRAADPAFHLAVVCLSPPTPRPAETKPSPKLHDDSDPVSAALLLGFDAVGLAIFSPFIAAKPLTDARLRSLHDTSQALLDGLQLGQPVPGGPEAFAKAHRETARWHPSTTVADYGILTIDLTTPVKGALRLDLEGDQKFAAIGVRGGKMEWLKFNQANLCRGADPAQPSAVRPGCSIYGAYNPRP